MIIATAGHVDHGKTSLVQQLTGIDTDRLTEEKARGLTIDLGFAYTEANGQTLGFIDVPGHIRFIHNMLAGVSIIDMALLVIAADDGPMPQTFEHLAILDMLGINKVITVITKIDRVSEERIAAVQQEAQTILARTSLSRSTIVTASNETGEGIDAIKQQLFSASLVSTGRNENGYFRLAIDRSFNVKGSGTVVTGSVFAGATQVGAQLKLMPAGTTVRVRGLHRQNEQSQSTVAGDRCALNLSGNLSPEDIHRGDWITNSPLPPTRRLDALISVPQDLQPITHGMPVHFHCAAMHRVGRIATLTDKRIESGCRGLVQVTLTEPLCVYPGDRLILRDQGAENTLAGGMVVDPFSPARGRARPSRIEWLNTLGGTNGETLRTLLQKSPDGVNIEAIKRSMNCLPETMDSWIDDVRATVPCEVIGEQLVSMAQIEAWGSDLISALTNWHTDNSDASGQSASGIRDLMDAGIPRSVKDHVIGKLLKDDKLSNHGGRYAIAGQQAQLKSSDQVLWKQIRLILSEDLLRPPVLTDLSKTVNNSPAVLAAVLKRCVQLGYVVQPTPNRYYLQAGLDRLVAIIHDLAAKKGGFTVRDFRDNSGLGRNLCIELLEYFDGQGLTIRDGDKRRVARSA